MKQPSRGAAKEIQRLNGLLYERALGDELNRLAEAFDEWRSAGGSPFELADRIHAFHQGPNRELYNEYVLGDASANVAAAIARGALKQKEVPDEVSKELQEWLEFYA